MSQSHSQAVGREQLLVATLASTKPVDRLEVTRVEFGPGTRPGRHLHPCPVAGVVTEGTIRFQEEGEEEKLLRTGDAFFEPAGVPISHFDNASDTDPAAFVAFYLLAEGETELIEMLDEGADPDLGG